MDFTLSEEHRLIQQTARDFARREVPRLDDELEALPLRLAQSDFLETQLIVVVATAQKQPKGA